MDEKVIFKSADHLTFYLCWYRIIFWNLDLIILVPNPRSFKNFREVSAENTRTCKMWTPSVSSYFLPGSLFSVLLNNDFAKLFLCLQSPPHPFPSLTPNELSSQLKCNLLSTRGAWYSYIFIMSFCHSQSMLPAESQSTLHCIYFIH